MSSRRVIGAVGAVVAFGAALGVGVATGGEDEQAPPKAEVRTIEVKRASSKPPTVAATGAVPGLRQPEAPADGETATDSTSTDSTPPTTTTTPPTTTPPTTTPPTTTPPTTTTPPPPPPQ